VFVIIYTDYGVDAFWAKSNEALYRRNRFVQCITRVTDSMEVKYFDITPISRQAKRRDLICTDGLHPSGKMYPLGRN